MSQAGVPDPNIRASDSDRERIVEQLRQHTADGRLTMDEFEERMSAAYAAKTYRELAELTRDLPVDLGAQGGRPAGAGAGQQQPPWMRHDWTRGPQGAFGRPAGSGENNPGEIVNALIGAAMDWKTQRQQMRDQLREQRHRARLARRAAQPVAARFYGWAALSTLLTGIWFFAGVTSGGHFGDFWPIWPIGILGLLTVLESLKTFALRRDLTRR